MQPIIVDFLKPPLPGFPAHQSGTQTSNPHLWIDILYLLEGITSTHPPEPEGNISTPDFYGKKTSMKGSWCLPSTRHSPRCLGRVSELCLSGMFCPDGHSPPSFVVFLQPHLLACLLFFLNASLRFVCLPPLLLPFPEEAICHLVSTGLPDHQWPPLLHSHHRTHPWLQLLIS